MEFSDTDRAIFQLTARLKDGSEDTVGYTADPTLEDETETTRFAEGVTAELAGA